MNKLIDWVQSQFKELGKDDKESKLLAVKLVSYMQGLALLSNTFKDENLVKDQKTAVNEWLVDEAV